jgi:hypothetical protein
MELPTSRSAPARRSPKLLTLFGQSKVGKTTTLAELDNCLILDTEKGTDFVSAMKVQVNSLNELMNVMKAVRDSDHKYEYIALDTLDNVVFWIEHAICAENKVKQIGDIPYGGGYAQVRDRVITLINRLKLLAPQVILIGHRKKTLIGSDSVEVNTSSLDLSGKLKNLVMADSDAIGFVYRDEEGNLKVTFEASSEIEAGSRCEHLRGNVIDFTWDKIYID